MQLSDVADAIDDAENVKQAAWMNDVPAVIVNIQRQPGSNVIEVVDRIKRLLPQLQSTLPPSVQVAVLTDRTTTIRASVEDVQFELMLAVGLVVLVIFLFLRNLSATIIPSVAVPVSLVGTFGVMYLLGFSLNNLSLMALTISTGFVVDDAIVMIENIVPLHRGGRPAPRGGPQGLGADRLHHPVPDHLAHRGADPAAVHGRRGGPAVPGVRRDPGGDHPDLGGGVPDPDPDDVRPAPQAHARGAAEPALPRLRGGFTTGSSTCYGRTLRWVLQHQTGTLLVAVADPGPDRPAVHRRAQRASSRCRTPGIILGISEAPQSISFAAMAERQQALAKDDPKDPAVESLSSFIGVDGTNTTLNSGRVLST